MEFTQQEPVQNTIDYAGKMPSPPTAARAQADLFVAIRIRCLPGSQSQIGHTVKNTNRQEVRVLIYEDEGLSLMVNLVPASKEDGMQPFDLYFYPDLDLAKKADLLHVYLAFRVAKILEANAINRKIDKVDDAFRGSR